LAVVEHASVGLAQVHPTILAVSLCELLGFSFSFFYRAAQVMESGHTTTELPRTAH